MLGELGQIALILALLVSVLQAALPLAGAQRGVAPWMAVARPAAYAQLGLVGLAFAVLLDATLVRGILLPAFLCGVLGLGVYSGAYVSEIVRGAIQSIDKGQTMAAQSLGMTPGVAMRQIVLPQAVVRMIPPLGNEFIALIKNSALVSLLTIHDVMHEGQKIISVSYRSLEVYLAIALVYFVLTGTMTLVLRHFEQKLRQGGLMR